MAGREPRYAIAGADAERGKAAIRQIQTLEHCVRATGRAMCSPSNSPDAGDNMKGLSGKVAIVTGGGSGLGEAIAKRLATEDVRVIVSDINLKRAEGVAQEITNNGGTASAVQQDTAEARDSERVVTHAVSAYGAVNYAVNNAGIAGAQAPAGDADLADWQRVIDINLSGVLYGMRYQIPAMLKAGRGRAACLLPPVGRSVVHDGWLLPGRRGLHRRLTA